MAKAVNATVICPYFALDEGEIPLKKGASVTILKQADGGFWLGRCGDKEGYFPFTCVEVTEGAVEPPPPPVPPRSTSPIPESGSLFKMPSEMGVLSRKVERLERQLREERERNEDSDRRVLELEKSLKAETAGRLNELQRSERLATAVSVLKSEAEKAVSARDEACKTLRVSTHEVSNLKLALKNEQRAHERTREEMERGRRVALPTGREDRDPNDRRRLVFSPDRFICETYSPESYDRTAYEDPSWNPGKSSLMDADSERLDFLYEGEEPVDGVIRIILAAWTSRLPSGAGWEQPVEGKLSCEDCVLVFGIICTEIGLPCPWFGYGPLSRATALMTRTMRTVQPENTGSCRVIELVAALQHPPWTRHVPTAIAPLLHAAMHDREELSWADFESVGLYQNQWLHPGQLSPSPSPEQSPEAEEESGEQHQHAPAEPVLRELALGELEEVLTVATPDGHEMLLVHCSSPSRQSPELVLLSEGPSPRQELIATLEVQLLATTEAQERVLDAQASAQEAEVALVLAAHQAESDTLASPTSPIRSRSMSLEAGEILSMAREAVMVLLGDSQHTELGPLELEELVLSVWAVMGGPEPQPNAAAIASTIVEEFGAEGVVVLDEGAVDPVLHHVLSHVMLDEIPDTEWTAHQLDEALQAPGLDYDHEPHHECSAPS